MGPESEKSANTLKKIMQEGDEERKFIRPKEAIRIYSMSRTSVGNISKKANALYRIGNLLLINVEKFEEYLEKHLVIDEKEAAMHIFDDEEV